MFVLKMYHKVNIHQFAKFHAINHYIVFILTYHIGLHNGDMNDDL